MDYLEPVKVNGKYVMTYKGLPLEKVQYPTKRISLFTQPHLIFSKISARPSLKKNFKMCLTINYSMLASI